jgi:hypothetical protein
MKTSTFLFIIAITMNSCEGSTIKSSEMNRAVQQKELTSFVTSGHE